MSNLKQKLIKQIQQSLFLDSERQAALLSALEKISEADQEKLLVILETERDFLRGAFKKAITKGGKEATSELERILGKTKTKMRVAKEENTKTDELQDAEKLLADL